MRVYRVLGAIGRALITAGVILLLFVAYQLWGTGLKTRVSQHRLETQLQDRLQAFSQAAQEESRSGGGSSTTVTTPTTAPEFNGQGLASVYHLTPAQVAKLPPPKPGQAVGKIAIPAIGSNWWYVDGVDLAYLRKGPGHFPGTAWPGQKGNAALAGHRTTYGAPFHRINELEPGDEIVITNLQGQFKYVVMSAAELKKRKMPIAFTNPADATKGHIIINPTDSWILADYHDNRITLMACNPKYSARQRIVVVGKLVGRVAPTTKQTTTVIPKTLPGESSLVGNDPAARLPAFLWALACAAIWFTAWQVGKTWRGWKWPAYLLASPLFFVALFICFTQVERMLPATY